MVSNIKSVALFTTGLPGVLFVLPDSYVDPENKDYGGNNCSTSCSVCLVLVWF